MVKASADEARRLLEAVRESTAHTAEEVRAAEDRYLAALAAAKAERAQAIRDALCVLPGVEVAKAAGVSRQRLYQLIRGIPTEIDNPNGE